MTEVHRVGEEALKLLLHRRLISVDATQVVQSIQMSCCYPGSLDVVVVAARFIAKSRVTDRAKSGH